MTANFQKVFTAVRVDFMKMICLFMQVHSKTARKMAMDANTKTALWSTVENFLKTNIMAVEFAILMAKFLVLVCSKMARKTAE